MTACSMPPEFAAKPARLANLQVVAGLVLVMLACAGVAALRIWPAQLAAMTAQAARAMDAMGTTGWLLAASVQVLIALCGILPASVGAFAAGMAYGIIGGFLVCGAATLVGAVLAFLLARGLFRPFVTQIMSRRPLAGRLEEAVVREGWRLVALMRLSPVMPFAATSYALGLTSLPLRQYLVGTLASLPALLGYVAMGHIAKAGVSSLASGQTGSLHWTALVLAAAATALLTLRLANIVRYALYPSKPVQAVQCEPIIAVR